MDLDNKKELKMDAKNIYKRQRIPCPYCGTVFSRNTIPTHKRYACKQNPKNKKNYLNLIPP